MRKWKVGGSLAPILQEKTSLRNVISFWSYSFITCVMRRKKNPTSLRRKKNWENNRRNIQKGCKIVSIKTAGAKQERNSVVTPKQKKVVEFCFFLILHVLEYAHSFQTEEPV